jgi:copper chaperone CopZ
MNNRRKTEMVKKVVYVNGMSCGHCEKAVEKALAAINVEAKASSKKGQVSVKFGPDTTLEKIYAAIKNAGFEVDLG